MSWLRPFPSLGCFGKKVTSLQKDGGHGFGYPAVQISRFVQISLENQDLQKVDLWFDLIRIFSLNLWVAGVVLIPIKWDQGANKSGGEFGCRPFYCALDSSPISGRLLLWLRFVSWIFFHPKCLNDAPIWWTNSYFRRVASEKPTK